MNTTPTSENDSKKQWNRYSKTPVAEYNPQQTYQSNKSRTERRYPNAQSTVASEASSAPETSARPSKSAAFMTQVKRRTNEKPSSNSRNRGRFPRRSRPKQSHTSRYSQSTTSQSTTTSLSASTTTTTTTTTPASNTRSRSRTQHVQEESPPSSPVVPSQVPATPESCCSDDVRFDDVSSIQSMDTPRSSSSDDFDEVEPMSPRLDLFSGTISRKYQEDPSQFFFMITVPHRNHMQRLATTRRGNETYRQEYLLPPRDPKDNRKTMVLDLDETLVHCFLNRSDFPTYDAILKVENEGVIMDVYCKIRPHVAAFLREAAKWFEIVVFTASQASYANKVLDRIDPNGYISHRLFRNHCEFHGGNYLKDLSKLGRNLKHTFIIDNFPLCFSFQPWNGIPCETWYDDVHDDELLRFLPVLRSLRRSNDVRNEIRRIWGTDKMLGLVRFHAEMTQDY